MNYQNKTKEELIKELQELQYDYNSLKVLYDKDITNRKRTEETLDQERALLRTIIDNFPNSIFVKDKKYRKIVVNLEHARRVTMHLSPTISFSVDDLLGKTDFEVYPRELAEGFLIEDQKIIDGGQSVLNHELLSIDTNGQTHWELISKIPLRDRNGEIIGLVGISNDITGRKQTEQAFLQSEENFRRSISESPFGIRIISFEGETIYVNKAFLDIYEYNNLEEFRSIPAINRYTPESYAQHQIRKEKIKNGHDIFDYEVSIVRKNAEVRYVKVWRKEVLWNGVKHYQTFNLDITEQKQSAEALNNSQQELRKFATHLQNVREEEKLSLAREIHDDLAQISVALKIDMGMFKKKISKGIEATTTEELLSKLKDFSGQVDNSIKSARRIMNGLRPELIELLGFEEACKSYLRDFEKTYQISSQFESTILNLVINLEQSVALFRILQETLTNVAKHAKAKVVKVQFSNQTNKLIMEIIDNGVGFDENNKGRQDSYGLIGMKERVFLLDGELNITSKVGQGTSVRVKIPYNSNPL
jgi:PAS domain S-box-containing protein